MKDYLTYLTSVLKDYICCLKHLRELKVLIFFIGHLGHIG
jgi:hypothetical protein